MGGKKAILVGNWKMNFSVKQAVAFAKKLKSLSEPGVVIAVAPHSLALTKVAEELEKSDIKLVAQNAYWRDEGAFTGEVSMSMLRGVADFVLIGHSERRHIFGERDEEIMQKVLSAVRSGITPVLCVGETLLERTHRHTNQVLHTQVTHGISQLTSSEVEKVIFAYEPVWAISNGKDYSKHAVPTLEDLEVAQRVIRHNIAELYGAKTAEKINVLYGGSVTPETASGFLSVTGINGLLVGGASLNFHAFKSIVEKASQKQ